MIEVTISRRKSLCFFIVLIITGVTFTAFVQRLPARQAAKPAIIQGICGTVVVKRGNYMPSPDSPRANPNGVAAEREVLIFSLLNMTQVDMGDDGFINSVRDAKPIKTTRSDKVGKFCVSLPAGRYSVMVREPGGLYANLSDGQGNIFPVTVPKNRQVTVGITISHQATF